MLYFTLLHTAGAGFPEDSEPISISHGNCKFIFLSSYFLCIFFDLEISTDTHHSKTCPLTDISIVFHLFLKTYTKRQTNLFSFLSFFFSHNASHYKVLPRSLPALFPLFSPQYLSYFLYPFAPPHPSLSTSCFLCPHRTPNESVIWRPRIVPLHTH